jgi:hypothetical protein
MPPDQKQTEQTTAEYNKTSMLDLLLKKLSFAISVGGENSAAANEVRRQMAQAARKNGGNPISGEGVTKSTDRDDDL